MGHQWNFSLQYPANSTSEKFKRHPKKSFIFLQSYSHVHFYTFLQFLKHLQIHTIIIKFIQHQTGQTHSLSMENSAHLSVLSKLCRICGRILSNRTFFVSEYMTQLEKSFRISLKSENPAIHPSNFCSTCFVTMTNISSKQTTHISTVLPEWSIHERDGNCTSCTLYNKLKKGGKRRKRKATGRPKATSSIWSRADSDSLLTSAQFHSENLPLDVTINQMHENNSNMNICICYFCRNIMCNPMIIQTCQHAFCALCLIKNWEGQEGRINAWSALQFSVISIYNHVKQDNHVCKIWKLNVSVKNSFS